MGGGSPNRGTLIGPIWAGFVETKAGWGTMAWSLGLLSGLSAIPTVRANLFHYSFFFFFFFFLLMHCNCRFLLSLTLISTELLSVLQHHAESSLKKNSVPPKNFSFGPVSKESRSEGPPSTTENNSCYKLCILVSLNW